jgi:Flp pilus assembly protein TadG
LSTVELAISAFALAIMTVLAVDLSVLMLGQQVLDRATRDAARAAAGQSTLANAINAAKGALLMHKTDGYFISQPVLTSTTSPDFVYQDYSGTPPGQVIPTGSPNAGQTAGNPFVSLTVQVVVRLPASFGALGVTIDQGPLTGGTMTFRRNYTFPIVKQSLNNNFG